MTFCLPKFEADTFLEKLKSGVIDPVELSKMSSADRRAFFEKIMKPEQAKSVNTLFESKLLLKNQQAGLVTWAKQIAGLKPEARRGLVDRIEKMKEALTPETEQAFLSDIVEQKLGVNVTMEEAANIAELSEAVTRAKAKMKSGGDRLEYGRAKVAFDKYVEGLKTEAQEMSFGELARNPSEALVRGSGTAKSIKTSLDNSAIFRQGWKTLMTNPVIWAKNAKASFSDLIRTVGGKEVMDEINADIVSRPNADLYQKAKLAVGLTEEAFPSSLPGKVPVLGRLFKGSETAYTGFVRKMRADVFDKYIEIAEKSGVDISDIKELRAIGQMVNSLTGRGSLDLGPLGNYETAGRGVNNIFFSPRNLKSHIDVLGGHALTGAGGSNFVRIEAAKNLVKIITGTAAVLVIADAVAPGSVEWDPKSSDFGKIRIGDTRFDVSGGMSSIPVLAARLITQKSKSSTTDVVSEINSDEYGSTQGQDVIYDFFENKLSPAAQVAEDLVISHQTFEGDKPTIGNQAKNLLAPLPYTNYEELRDNPNSANTLAAMIADALGIGTNTYSKK